nr:MAG TPA: hypothetical protein [Caudoviricetes sp.]
MLQHSETIGRTSRIALNDSTTMHAHRGFFMPIFRRMQ